MHCLSSSLLAILFFLSFIFFLHSSLIYVSHFIQYPTAFTGASPPQGTEEEMKKALENMNGKLEGKKYLAGDTLTLADLSAVFDLSWLEIHPTFGHVTLSECHQMEAKHARNARVQKDQ